MKVDINKLHDKFNKRWIGWVYGYSTLLIYCSFGAIVGFALGEAFIYFFLLLLLIGYAIALPIGFIRAYIRKNYSEERK